MAKAKKAARPEHIERAIETLRKGTKSAPARVGVSLGRKIDALYHAREQRLAAQREVDQLKKIEHATEQEVIALLNAENLTGSKGKDASVSIVTKIVPKADPAKWNDIFAWIAKTAHFELLHKRISSEAYRDLLQAGEKVPNISTETVLDLSIRAL